MQVPEQQSQWHEIRRSRGEIRTISGLVRVDVACPVLKLEVFEDNRAVVDSSGTRVVLVDVRLGREGISRVPIDHASSGGLPG